MAEVPDLRLCAYSARLFQPFIRLLNRTQLVPDEWADAMRALDPDERLPAAVAHQLLDGILSLGVDPNFGLIAGREWNSGDGGALDYAVTSAGTVRESIEAAGRYVPPRERRCSDSPGRRGQRRRDPYRELPADDAGRARLPARLVSSVCSVASGRRAAARVSAC